MYNNEKPKKFEQASTEKRSSKFCKSRGEAICELLRPFCEHDCVLCCIYALTIQVLSKGDANFNLRNSQFKRTNR